MAQGTCSVDGCNRTAAARGWCHRHYNRWHAGRELGPAGSLHDPVVLFWSKVDKTDTCWRWTGSVSDAGYGVFSVKGKLRGAHRVSYEMNVGPIPDGMHIHHRCEVRDCVNPAHLEPLTPRQNVLLSSATGAVNARKTHCVNGHEYTPESTRRTKSGARVCRTCGIDRKANRYGVTKGRPMNDEIRVAEEALHEAQRALADAQVLLNEARRRTPKA